MLWISLPGPEQHLSYRYGALVHGCRVFSLLAWMVSGMVGQSPLAGYIWILLHKGRRKQWLAISHFCMHAIFLAVSLGRAFGVALCDQAGLTCRPPERPPIFSFLYDATAPRITKTIKTTKRRFPSAFLHLRLCLVLSRMALLMRLMVVEGNGWRMCRGRPGR